jgi:hypothetical protein
MSVAPARQKALVYANAQAQKQAAALLSRGVVLENVVAQAIERGDVSPNGIVYLGGGVVAYCERRPGRMRPKPSAWFITKVERATRTRR